MGSEAPVSLGEVVAGKYKVTRFLGAGGMGVVVEAEHLELGQSVALKFLHSSAVANAGAAERFLREARAAVRIRSEHVARVLDVGRDEAGTPFMVMEYLDGRDLGQIIREDAPIEIARGVGYMLQACEAIAVAHAIGIVHRDLKPSNIFVTTRPDGTPLVKVLDFGISKAIESGAPLSLTSTGEILGSPIYMSPEQLRNTRGVDRRTDIWSLGTVLYELLTGRHPFEADTMPTLCAMIAADAPQSLCETRPDVPADLEAVVLRCLEKQPANRFGSVADFARALVPFAGSDALAIVGRISRIAAGNETTAASAIATPGRVPATPTPQPPPHEATAPSPVAPPPAPAARTSPPVRRIRALPLGVALLAVAVTIVVVRITKHPALSPSADAPAPTLASTELPGPPVPVASGLVARGAPAEARTEPEPTAIAAEAGAGTTEVARQGSPMKTSPAETLLQARMKPKPHASAAIASVTTPHAPPPPAEKPPLDPLIDQR